MPAFPDTIIEWVFALVSVFIVWRLDLPQHLGRLAIRSGASPGSLTYKLIVDGLVPVALAVCAYAFLLLHQFVVWPYLPSSNYVAGWWVYGLVAEGGKGSVDIVGRFRVAQAPREARILDGRAFYIRKDTLSYRGDWTAEMLALQKERIQFIFSMAAVNPAPEAIPSKYDGYVDIRRVASHGLARHEVWQGYFQDLGDRRKIAGPLYAERLGRSSGGTADEVDGLLDSLKTGILERVRLSLSPQR